jgi:hypothetical protein
MITVSISGSAAMVSSVISEESTTKSVPDSDTSGKAVGLKEDMEDDIEDLTGKRSASAGKIGKQAETERDVTLGISACSSNSYETGESANTPLLFLRIRSVLCLSTGSTSTRDK